MYVESSSLGAAVDAVHEAVVRDKIGMLKMSVPSLCYTLQNFMIFVAITNLDVTTYQARHHTRQSIAFTHGR